MQVIITAVQGQHLSLNFHPLCFYSSSYFPDSPSTKDTLEAWRIHSHNGCVRQEIITIVTYLLSYCLNILIILYLLFSSLLRSGLLEILNLDSFFANSFPLYRRRRWESQSLISVPLVWTGTVCFPLLTDTVLALAVFLKLRALSTVFLAGRLQYGCNLHSGFLYPGYNKALHLWLKV